ncbi:prepilin peptidase [Nitrosovibrio tenuis]|uniref:Prepilin leader peptidase/N-methyltransferase n=1 Tax=Nitrosovibrio tenuis TaxID=1233 RepID=A0A1H7QD89_9PROT|nr:A24 family peptidase [Nitrosovibrio tenuis]SEL45614.1 type 4 prepilin peptidase 1 Aspartic peptidase. MEROPS family A24A [Nitrosovibrio tenuis]
MSFIYLLQNSPAFLISFCSLIGLVAGSFLNVVIIRLPKMLERDWARHCAGFRAETVEVLPPYNIVTPRSACLHCGHKITALENIPVMSYVLLRGRCSQCHASISLRYPAVELLTALTSGYIAWHFGYGFATLATLAFTWTMIVLAFIDIDTQLLPNDITVPLLWAGLLVNLANTFTSIHSAVLGAVAGYISLWSIYWGFKLVTGREGMGYGDFKLLAAIGAWLGWQMLPLVILVSSIAGTIVGILLITVAKRGRHEPIPFGPYLAGGGFVALLWGSQINEAYWGLF